MKSHSVVRLFPLALVALVAVSLQAATPKPTRTTFASSARQVTEGDSVTLKATVAAIAAPDGNPTGSVEFFDGATSLGSVELASTEAGTEGSLALTTLGVGPHPITVRYSGDATFAGSVTAPEFILILARQ